MQISFKPGTGQESDSKLLMENSMLQTGYWMHANRLKLNPKKTEVILFGRKVQLSKCDMNTVSVCNNIVVRSNIVQYLGAWYDETMNFNHHVIVKCKVAALNLGKIRLIQKFIERESCEILICSSVLSHLDYGNSLLKGCTNIVLNRLQIIQNFAAKVVLDEPRKYNSIRALYKLHWLPIHGHIELKILLMVYKCLTDTNTPVCLHDLLIHSNGKRMCSNLTSNDDNEHLLIIPYVKYKTYLQQDHSVGIGTKL